MEDIEFFHFNGTEEEWDALVKKRKELEEAAENYVRNESDATLKLISKYSFKDGAKWQQEQDKNKYSEEEVLGILDKREEHLDTQQSIFDYTTNKEWFEQYKKGGKDA